MIESDPGQHSQPRWNGSFVVVAVGVAAAVVLAYFVLGMPGMDHGGSSGGDHAAMIDRLEPDRFAERLQRPGSVVINVHTPYAGEIVGTDLFVPHDEIAEAAELPADKAASILLYCETGEMSAEAAVDLMEAGYTDVADLDGGMRAWVASGRAVARRGN